eukprot:CAMPEP_0198321956 /NCGR_PEP_ID=MMETSP1450-20131203/10563_1 /TAXON_ID=753684 ORGANISM="Madagascaria erythrocladiodes, Strain CCMP3234" /NCGR_SAMPLE_ID=MMETSP1450 /ASSEMBLY_ACC=CAM_ASM_001115 /LENGTH=356 /DNA_ID=CAMNT_0044025541 /DNA_START=69 /DNA_END=1139 /DNA_ORIENTATION=-
MAKSTLSRMPSVWFLAQSGLIVVVFSVVVLSLPTLLRIEESDTRTENSDSLLFDSQFLQEGPPPDARSGKEHDVPAASETIDDTVDDPEDSLVCGGPCGQRYIARVAKVSKMAGDNVRRALCHNRTRVSMSDAPLIIDASPGSTGTRSLARALAAIGLKVLHCTYTVTPTDKKGGAVVNNAGGRLEKSSLADLFRARANTRVDNCHAYYEGFSFHHGFEPYDAVMDAPFAEAWYDIFLAHPNSKVIFTDRDEKSWAERRLSHSSASLPYLHPCAHRRAAAWDDVGGPEPVAELFAANREFIQCVVPEDRFLYMSVYEQQTPREFWDRLIGFVGRDSSSGYVGQHCGQPRDFRLSCT